MAPRFRRVYGGQRFPLKEEAFHNLLEGIPRYGLENVSTLSKWIDIPVETVRYMIWEELPRFCISVGITVNLPRIGLGRWILYFRAADKSSTPAIEKFLRDEAGTMYQGRVLPNNCSFSTLGIPFGEHYKVRDQLEELVSSNVISSYSLEEIEFFRNVSFNSSFFDFKERKWKFSWDEVRNIKESLLTQDLPENQAPVVDYKDILILKELQRSVPRTLSKLSESIGLDQHNLRYHYKTHARQAISGYYLKKLNSHRSRASESVILFQHEYESHQSLEEGRRIALSIPFTQGIWKTERFYSWYVSCPGEYVNGLMKFVNESFSRVPGRLETFFIDSETEFVGTIPYNLFDEKNGNWNYELKSALSVIEK